MSARAAGKSAFVFVFITVLVDSIGFGIILPVLPGLIMQLTGVAVDRAAAYGGWPSFVYALMQFFCAPVLGNLSDRFGRRPVILFALLALGCDYLIMGFAPAIGWLYVGRLIAGCAGASFTPAYAYVADITEPAKRAQSFGLMGAAFGIGFIAGPAIGGLLGAFGPRAPFFAAGAIALANFCFGYLVLPESLSRASRRPFDWRRANPLGTFRQILKYRVVTLLLGALLLWQLGHQVLPSTWAFYTICQVPLDKCRGRWLPRLRGTGYGGRAGAADEGVDSMARRRAARGAGRHGCSGTRVRRVCIRNSRLDDVRNRADDGRFRAYLSRDECARLATHSR